MTKRPGTPFEDRYGAAALMGLCLVLYGASSLPGLGWYDTAEFQTTGAILGISHPPGYPLLNLLGRLASLCGPGEPARAITLLTVLLGAVVPALSFLLLRSLEVSFPSALAASLALALSPAFWDQAVRAEAYTLDLALCLSALLVPHFIQNRKSAWGIASLIWSLALFHRPTSLFLLPWALVLSPGLGSSLRGLIGSGWRAACGFLLGGSVLLYLPLRSSPGTLRLYFGAETWDKFSWLVQAKGFWGRVRLETGEIPGRFLEVFAVLFDSMDAIFLLLAWIGLMVLVRRTWWRGAAAAVSLSLALLFGIVYQVQDLPAFLLSALFSLSLLAGLGLDALGTEFSQAWRRRALVWAFFMLLVQAPLTFRSLDQSSNRTADAILVGSLQDLPALAVIVQDMTSSDWAKVSPLWYGVYVRKIRPDLRFRDDFQYRLLKESPPPREATFVLKKDPALSGRFLLKAEGSLYRLFPRAWMHPSPRAAGRYHFLDLSGWGNADYNHDPFMPNPTLGGNHFPSLASGIVSWKGVPFRIAPPYSHSGLPSVFTVCHQAGLELEIPLKREPTDEVWFLLDGRGFGSSSKPVGFIGVRLEDGFVIGRELIALEDVWDYENRRWGTPLPDGAVAYGENEEQSLTSYGISLPRGSRPTSLVLRSIRAADLGDAPAGFTIFAVTQALR